jgi:uncharacterized protein YhjY with autotransporter beta-barrel domain
MKRISRVAAFVVSFFCIAAMAAELVGPVVVSGTETRGGTGAGSCSSVSITISGMLRGTVDDGNGVDNVLFLLGDDDATKGRRVIPVPFGQTVAFSETLSFGGLVQTRDPGVGVGLYDVPSNDLLFGDGNYQPTIVAAANCAPPKPVCTVVPDATIIFTGQSTTFRATCGATPNGATAPTYSWIDPDATSGGVPGTAQFFARPKVTGDRRYSVNVCYAYTEVLNSLSCDTFSGSVKVLPAPSCTAKATPSSVYLGQPTTLSAEGCEKPANVNRSLKWSGPSSSFVGTPSFAPEQTSTMVTPSALGVNTYHLEVCDSIPNSTAVAPKCASFPVVVNVVPAIAAPTCVVKATPDPVFTGQTVQLAADCGGTTDGRSRDIEWVESGQQIATGAMASVSAGALATVRTITVNVCDKAPKLAQSQKTDVGSFKGCDATLSKALQFTVRETVATPVCVPSASPSLVAVSQNVELRSGCSAIARGVSREVEWVEVEKQVASREVETIMSGTTVGVRTLTLNVCDKAPQLAQSRKIKFGRFVDCDAGFSGTTSFTVRAVVVQPTCAPIANPNPVVVGRETELRAMCSDKQTTLVVRRDVEWVDDATGEVIATAESQKITAGALPSTRAITLNVCDKVAVAALANKASIGRLRDCEGTFSAKFTLTTIGVAASCSALTSNITGRAAIDATVKLTATCSGIPAITNYTWSDATTNVQLGSTQTNTFDVKVPISGIKVRVTPNNGIAGATGAQIDLAAEAPVVAVVAQPTVTMVAGDKREFKVTVRSSTGTGVAGVPVTWTDVEQQSTTVNAACGAASGTPQTVNTDATGTATISYTFPANSCGRTLTATTSGVSTSFKLVSAAVTVTQPAQQAVQAIAQIALVAPQVQLNNIRSRQEQLRTQGAQPKVKSDLKVSAAGTPVPIGALASLFDGGAPATGLNGSGDDFERWGVFLNGDVELGSYNANNGFKGFDARSRGITLGADYRFDGNHAIGIGLGAARSKAQIADAGGQQESRGTSVALFGSFIPRQDTYIDGTVLFGRMNYEVSRAVRDDKNALLGMAVAKPDGNQMAVALSAGANFNVGSFRLNPYGRFERISATIGGFAETGPQALSITEQKVAVSTISAGAQAVATFNTSFAILQPNIRLEFNRNIRDSRRAVFASLVNDADPLTRFALATAIDDKSYGTIGVGMSFLFQRGITAFVQIEESFASETAKRRRYSFGVRVPL